MLSPSLTSWRAQYDRLARSCARVNRPYESSVEYDDDLQHYFQDCWHLKDWIKNDPTSGGLVSSKKKDREFSKEDSLYVLVGPNLDRHQSSRVKPGFGPVSSGRTGPSLHVRE